MRIHSTLAYGPRRLRARRLQEQSRQRRFAFWRIYTFRVEPPEQTPATRASER